MAFVVKAGTIILNQDDVNAQSQMQADDIPAAVIQRMNMMNENPSGIRQ